MFVPCLLFLALYGFVQTKQSWRSDAKLFNSFVDMCKKQRSAKESSWTWNIIKVPTFTHKCYLQCSNVFGNVHFTLIIALCVRLLSCCLPNENFIGSYSFLKAFNYPVYLKQFLQPYTSAYLLRLIVIISFASLFPQSRQQQNFSCILIGQNLAKLI